MSELENNLRSVIRDVVREEIASIVPDAPPKLLSAAKAGEAMGGLDKQTIYRLVRENALKVVYISEHRFLVSESEIERFIREGGVRKPCLKEVAPRKVQRGGR